MSGLALAPIPFDEARKLIENKPAVTKAVFAQMLPEIQGLAFVITGVEAVNVLQKSRQIIAGLPQGRNWEDMKEELLAEISPWIITGDTEEERAASARAAERRATLLMRLHGFGAYETAHSKVMEEMGDVFSHWRWQTMGDGLVRDSHKAMDGITLPRESPFWRTIWPRRGWNCRCQLVGITPEEAEAELEMDRRLDPEARKYLEGPALKILEEGGLLNRGLNKQFNLSKEAANGPQRQFGSLRIHPDDLRGRYDADVWNEFEFFAKRHDLGDGRTVWQWMTGEVATVVAEVIPSDTAPAVTEAMAARTVPGLVQTLAGLRPAYEAARAKADLARRTLEEAQQKALGELGLAEATRLMRANADAIFERLKILPEGVAAARAALREAVAEVEAHLNEARQAVAIPAEARGKVRFLGQVPNKVAERVNEGAELTAQYTRAELLPEVEVYHLRGKKPRAYHRRSNGVSGIHVGASVSPSTVMHEITHATEQATPDVLAAANDFLEARGKTPGAKVVKLAKRFPGVGYRRDEEAWEDEWESRGGHLYVGKDYGGRATELLTMGIERLHRDPHEFATRDADYFTFVLTTLQGLPLP